MRIKINIQQEFNFQPSNLKLTNEYFKKYEAISRILDENPKIIELVHADLKHPLKYVVVRGQDGAPHKYTSDQVLRILLAQLIEGASLRQIVIRIDDSHMLREFARIHNGPMIDFTTLDKLKNSIRPKTWKKVNRLLAKYAVQEDLIGFEKLRLDTTAVETNIHYPTDSSLLWDCYRVLDRLIRQAREMDPKAGGEKRLHPKRAKKLAQKIARVANKKGHRAEILKPLYQQLLERVEGISNWALDVAQALRETRSRKSLSPFEDAMILALIEQLSHYEGLSRQVLSQATRRVLRGDPVPNDEKLFSIFEPHTELLIRGKAGKPVEFGHMIQIQQVGQKFITDYDAFEKKPVEHELLEPAIRSHRALFGKDPKELGADKGYYESRDQLKALRKKIKVVSIAKKGRRTAKETERETDPAFRHTQRFRAGVEGTISFLKRVLRLLRCFNKGWEHFAATIGATVFAHNLLILARF